MFQKKKQDAEPKLSDHNVIFYTSTVTFLHPPPKKKKCCLQCYSSALLQLTAFPFCPPFPPPKNVPLAPQKIRKPPYTHPHPPKKTKTGSHSPDSPYPSPPHPTPPPTCPRKTQKTEVFTVQIPPNPDTPPPPPTQKSLATLPLRIFRFPLGPISTNYWEEAATVYSPDFSQSSPQGILDNKKMPAWKPSIFPLGLGWPGPKFPEFIGRPGQRKTIVKTGGLQPRFSPKRSTPNLGENKTFSFFPHQRSLGRALRKNLGWKPPYSLWFPLAWGFSQSSPQGILDNKKCRLENPLSSLWFP